MIVKQQLWLISYSWRRRGRENIVYTQEVWEGSLAKWMERALEQPEEWHLTFATEITNEEYERLNKIL